MCFYYHAEIYCKVMVYFVYYGNMILFGILRSSITGHFLVQITSPALILEFVGVFLFLRLVGYLCIVGVV